MNGGEGGVTVDLPAGLLRSLEGETVVGAAVPTVTVPVHPVTGAQGCTTKKGEMKRQLTLLT